MMGDHAGNCFVCWQKNGRNSAFFPNAADDTGSFLSG